MSRLGLTTADLAEALCMPINFVAEILVGRRPVELGLACRLEKITGHRRDYWLRLQGRFEGRIFGRERAAQNGCGTPPAMADMESEQLAQQGRG